ELVAVGMFRAAIVVVKTAAFAASQMRGDVERRVGERPAKMSGLRVVAEQDQRHARHETDVFELLLVAQVEAVDRSRRNGGGFYVHGWGDSIRGHRPSPPRRTVLFPRWWRGSSKPRSTRDVIARRPAPV